MEDKTRTPITEIDICFKNCRLTIVLETSRISNEDPGNLYSAWSTRNVFLKQRFLSIRPRDKISVRLVSLTPTMNHCEILERKIITTRSSMIT